MGLKATTAAHNRKRLYQCINGANSGKESKIEFETAVNKQPIVTIEFILNLKEM